MAQKLRDDKIGTIQHNAGSIQMLASSSSPAYLTVGGQQYKITSNLSRLIASDVTMVANTRYQVFAVVNSGVVELRVSLNENSVGPSGFTRWLLIGSFYANGLASVAFGSFVNINGVPETDWWDARTDIGANFLTGASGNPSYGTTTTNIYKIKRIGNRILGYWRYRQTAAGGGGSGNYYIKQLFPAIDTYYRADNSQIYVGKVGEFHGKEVTSGAYLVSTYMFVAPNPNQDKLQVRIAGVVSGSTLEGDWGSAIHHLGVANISYGFDYDYVTSSFDMTPIKDL